MSNINEDILLKKIHGIELDMLSEVDRICKKIHTNYFLVGGTLLGAVRHQGFIPWDDDIDVGMLRNDYEKFIKEAVEHLPDNLFLQTYESDEKAPFCFAKLRNSNTTFIERSSKNINMNHGAFIDIFPFDYYPENALVAVLKDWMIRLTKHKIYRSLYFSEGQQFTIIGKVANWLSEIVFSDTRSAVKLQDRIIKSGKPSKYITNYCGAWGKKEIVPADYVTTCTLLEFEGQYYSVPKKYHDYLTHVYGDYMKFPPPEKRVRHHSTEIIDLDQPYTKYVNQGNE